MERVILQGLAEAVETTLLRRDIADARASTRTSLGATRDEIDDVSGQTTFLAGVLGVGVLGLLVTVAVALFRKPGA